MATAAQITANRFNAQHSTGPKTAEGRTTSARNATRHGLSAATFHVLVHEDQAEFDALTVRLKSEHQPATLYESFLVEQLSRAWWLLSRAQRLAAKAFDYMAGSPLDAQDPDVIVITRLFELNPNTLITFQRHAERAEKSFYRARRELKSAQENRAAVDAEPVPEAIPEPAAKNEPNEPNLPSLSVQPEPLAVETSNTVPSVLRYNSGVNDPDLRNQADAGGSK